MDSNTGSVDDPRKAKKRTRPGTQDADMDGEDDTVQEQN